MLTKDHEKLLALYSVTFILTAFVFFMLVLSFLYVKNEIQFRRLMAEEETLITEMVANGAFAGTPTGGVALAMIVVPPPIPPPHQHDNNNNNNGFDSDGYYSDVNNNNNNHNHSDRDARLYFTKEGEAYNPWPSKRRYYNIPLMLLTGPNNNNNNMVVGIDNDDGAGGGVAQGLSVSNGIDLFAQYPAARRYDPLEEYYHNLARDDNDNNNNNNNNNNGNGAVSIRSTLLAMGRGAGEEEEGTAGAGADDAADGGDAEEKYDYGTAAYHQDSEEQPLLR